MSRPLFFSLALLTISPAARAETPRFTARDAIVAEWNRQPIPLDDQARAALPVVDRARLLLAEKRIGAPGAPPLLPPELDKPDIPTWEALAKKAKTPQERFTALHFLNRLKSTHALSALDGLTVADAKSWPKLLHLDAHVATARLRGEVVSAELSAFLAALPVDPVRAQAARLRLVLEGKEKQLLPPLQPTPSAVLALLDAWNRAPWPVRQVDHLALMNALAIGLEQSDERAWAGLGRQRGAWSRLGLQSPTVVQLLAVREAALLRLFDGVPEYEAAREVFARVAAPRSLKAQRPAPERADDTFWNRQWQAAVDAALERFGKAGAPPQVTPAATLAVSWQAARSSMDVLDRVRLIQRLTTVPDFFDALIVRVLRDSEVDSLQALIEAFERLKLPPEQRVKALTPFLGHATWIARYEAWKALSAIDPKTPWPKTPPSSPATYPEELILDAAKKLVTSPRPVRFQITFSKNRTIVLKLDTANAPLNVANLMALTQRKFFDGRRVPRVVPDFVVQMGSPIDTMDGGPGYAVRCEDSLDWYGPGSVGMALSGKDTGGSQLFITTNATPHLTGRYTRVGEVEDPARALPILDELELGAKIERIEVLK